VVKSQSPCLSVLLLTEDSSEDAFKTVECLAKELLKQVDEYTQTQPSRLTLAPLRGQEALRAMGANLWKSDKREARPYRVDLVQRIATHILQGETSWVFFHFDGDRSWAQRTSSENAAKFATHILDKVLSLLKEHLAKRAGAPSTEQEREELARALLARIKPLIPYYSIESWLYQNTRQAILLCQKHHGGRHAEKFLEWERNRAALDEERKPKATVCLGAKHNLELARHEFPAREARSAGKSFEATLQLLQHDEALREALRRTYTYEP
jgi:hypothetical protein